MYLAYLPANMAWVFLFGHDINTATIQDMGGFGRFFSTRKDAVNAAKECGLVVSRSGVVTTRESEIEYVIRTGRTS